MDILTVIALVLIVIVCTIGSCEHQENYKPEHRYTNADLYASLAAGAVLIACAWFFLPANALVFTIWLSVYSLFSVARWLGAKHYNHKENINQ